MEDISSFSYSAELFSTKKNNLYLMII